jgi:hypothetical protein
MKSRPILFSAPMVRAILNGTKTQTRRIVTPQPLAVRNVDTGPVPMCHPPLQSFAMSCKYGQPGDQLWVRETYWQTGHWESVPGIKTKTGRTKWKFLADSPEIRFDPPPAFRKGRNHETPDYSIWHKRLGRFMPRASSRLTLELTAVTAERLQAITHDDAIAEGIFLNENDWWDCGNGLRGESSPQAAYRALWDTINGPGSWNQNPWVWAIGFRPLPSTNQPGDGK